MSNNSTFLFVRNDFENDADIQDDTEFMLDRIDSALSRLLSNVENNLPKINNGIVQRILDFAASK